MITLSVILTLQGMPPIASAGEHPSTVTFENRSGEAALVILRGPTKEIVEVPNGESRTVHAAEGGYGIMVRYGSEPEGYRYARGDPFTETEREYSVISITLHPVIGGNYPTHRISKDEFDGALVGTQRPHTNQ
ncbi:MAG: hypothetical protein V1878_06535 [bacterium]